MEPKNRTSYFAWLRLFAAFAVVLMHTAAQHFNTGAVGSGPWTWSTLWDSLVRWPVPVFMMITGALFLPRKTPLREFLTRYVPRMGAAYLIWSGIYALHGSGDFLAELAAGHYHLWYLPFLCGVYLAMPFLQRIVSDKTLENALLAVSAVIGLLVPWLADMLMWLLPDWSGIIRSVKGHLEFTFFMDCLALVLLGHFLHQREQTPKQRRLLYVLGLLGIFVTCMGTLWTSQRSNGANTLFFDFKAPNNLCTAVAIFVFAKYALKKLPKAVDFLARCSFGIYLVHPLVIEVLAQLGLVVPAPFTPALAAVVFVISAAVSAALGKLPFIGRFLA